MTREGPRRCDGERLLLSSLYRDGWRGGRSAKHVAVPSLPGIPVHHEERACADMIGVTFSELFERSFVRFRARSNQS